MGDMADHGRLGDGGHGLWVDGGQVVLAQVGHWVHGDVADGLRRGDGGQVGQRGARGVVDVLGGLLWRSRARTLCRPPRGATPGLT